ncbi:NAD(P)H-dependent flavin oxidoreductase [Mycolicibacter sinensis]|uniref:Monooxygenase n=1 Tax=Mycolicibacter sinensis (strain JDM601) TaxID=875328 RepID=A0A1A2EAJ4_MYCSD|nr:nitronate monooxygenase [Mycolicibacter sinensis]OBG02573.1 monooxygenase [Mycolicibacter sinensis]OBG03057.1 monooxygenase [Mycolicibacter sinensis]
MKTQICEMFGIEFPVLAFSHCRDVVAAVTNAGGFGVLGASSHSPEQLEHELTWIDEHVGGKPYGVDIVCPEKFEGKGLELTSDQLLEMVPDAHRDYVVELLGEHGVSMDEIGERPFQMMQTLSDSIGEKLLEVSFRHPIKLIANALGVPPQFMIDRAKAEAVPVAALVGAKEHAIKQVQAGVDVLVVQGTEAGGHCGEVTTMVLVPEVKEAIKAIRDVPVLAAGGIVTGRQVAASIALGAAGAWTGSVWLTTEEAETAPYTVQKMLAANSRDTVRSKGRTGKYSRQLKSAWTDAWEPGADGPGSLPMPLQAVLSDNVLRRIDVLAENGNKGAQELATYWVGQGVGLMNKVKPAREVVREMIEDYIDAAESIAKSLADN